MIGGYVLNPNWKGRNHRGCGSKRELSRAFTFRSSGVWQLWNNGYLSDAVFCFSSPQTLLTWCKNLAHSLLRKYCWSFSSQNAFCPCILSSRQRSDVLYYPKYTASKQWYHQRNSLKPAGPQCGPSVYSHLARFPRASILFHLCAFIHAVPYALEVLPCLVHPCLCSKICLMLRCLGIPIIPAHALL